MLSFTFFYNIIIYGETMDFKKHIKLRLWVKLVIFFSIIIFSTYFYARYISVKEFNVKEYPIVNKNIPSSFYGFKVVHISDIHYKVTTNYDDLKKIIKKINMLKPDIVILSGDLFNKHVKYTKKDYEDITKILSTINYTIEKFAIKGDNDLKIDEWDSIIENSNFTNLNDTYKLIYYKSNDPILITGISSNLKDNHMDLLKEIENNYRYSILVVHEPDYVDNKINYNLILAGHSLGGRIKIPYIGGIINDKGATKYNSDYYKLKRSELYISSGIGSNIYPFRFLNKPSINLYRLRNK